MKVNIQEKEISLINENDYLDNQAVVQACIQFGERSNWVKQQYLKMKFVYY